MPPKELSKMGGTGHVTSACVWKSIPGMRCPHSLALLFDNPMSIIWLQRKCGFYQQMICLIWACERIIQSKDVEKVLETSASMMSFSSTCWYKIKWHLGKMDSRSKASLFHQHSLSPLSPNDLNIHFHSCLLKCIPRRNVDSSPYRWNPPFTWNIVWAFR